MRNYFVKNHEGDNPPPKFHSGGVMDFPPPSETTLANMDFKFKTKLSRCAAL